MPMTLLAVGADPEFFVRDRTTGKPQTICGKLGGTKHEPIRPFHGDEHSGILEDNVMVEFNIMPATSAEDFKNHIMKVMVHLREVLLSKGLVIDIVPSQVFDNFSVGPTVPQSMEIGCLGDYSAWRMNDNPRITPEELGNVRTSGGHVHISFLGENGSPRPIEKVWLVRTLDLALGVPSVLMDHDHLRRKFYGRAGAYRDKPYGVEYRTISNFWIKTPELMKWVFNNVQWAIDNCKSAGGVYQTDLESEEMVQEVIRTGSEEKARKLISKFNIPLPEGVA